MFLLHSPKTRFATYGIYKAHIEQERVVGVASFYNWEKPFETQLRSVDL